MDIQQCTPCGTPVAEMPYYDAHLRPGPSSPLTVEVPDAPVRPDAVWRIHTEERCAAAAR